jgi:hypothetical protein
MPEEVGLAERGATTPNLLARGMPSSVSFNAGKARAHLANTRGRACPSATAIGRAGGRAVSAP